MNEARGLRDVNPRAGTFVLAGLLVAAVGVFLAGRAQGWFEQTLRVRARTSPIMTNNAVGLQEGAEVQILGTTVGSVRAVRVLERAAPNGPEFRLEFDMDVRGRMRPFVRKDSQALIQHKFGVAGSAFVMITPGSGAPADEGQTFDCDIPADLTTMAQSAVNVMANVEQITANLKDGKGPVGRLLGDEAAGKDLRGILAHVERVTASLAKGDSMAARLLNDPEAGEQLKGSMASLQQSLDSVNKLLARAESADVKPFADQLRQTLVLLDRSLEEVTKTTAALREQAGELPALIVQTQEMMRQTTRMIEGVQKTWLLRDYVAPEGSSRLSPADVTSP